MPTINKNCIKILLLTLIKKDENIPSYLACKENTKKSTMQ